MDVFHMLQQVSLFALLTVLVGLVPPGVAALYARHPSEQWLALMRPLSLAAIFAALGSLVSGVMVILQGIAATQAYTVNVWSRIAMGVTEAIAPMFVIFGCQTLAWLLVAVGMRRAETP